MKHFTDNQLISSLDNIVRREREILAEVLNHFKEFDRRKLFSKLGYSSLHEYAVKHLKYSDDQAYRRVQAMRLMRDIPEIETKIEEGSLTLSSLSQAQSFFRKVEHTKEEKREVLSKLQNTTKREAQKICQQDSKLRYSFEADDALENIIERLRALNPHLSFDQLAKKVFEQAFKSTDPATKNRAVMKPRATKSTASGSSARTSDHSTASKPSGAAASKRYIPANLKREVWLQSKGKCENCSSAFGLEFDHHSVCKGWPDYER